MAQRTEVHRADTADASLFGNSGPLGWFALIGALVYVATVPLESLAQLGKAGSLAKGGGALLVAGAGFALIGGALRVRRTDASILVMGGFVAWSTLSYFWTSDTTATLARMLTNVQLLLATVVLWQVLSNDARVRAVVQAFVVGNFFGSVYALVTRHPHQNGVARYSVGNPNSFGLYVVWAMLASYWLLGEERSRRWKWFYGLFFVVGTLEVFSTASRTALVALGFALVVAVADRRFMTPRNVAIALVLSAAATFAVIHVVSSRQLQRLSTVSQAATTGLNGRSTQWRMALDVFSAHPVEGMGAAGFRDFSAAATGVSKVAHNSFLGVAADLGTVGVVLFIAMFVIACRRLIYLDSTPRRLWLGLVALWLTGASTLTWEDQKFTFLVLILFAAQGALATARAPERPRAAVAELPD